MTRAASTRLPVSTGSESDRPGRHVRSRVCAIAFARIGERLDSLAS